MKTLLAPLVLALGTLSAAAGPLPDNINIGPAVTIDVPAVYSVGQPFEVSGNLYATFGLPVIVEIAEPISGERIDVLVDDVVAGSAVTDSEGAYSVELTFGAEPPHQRMVRAVAYRESLLETSSRTEATTIDRFVTQLWIEPGSASVAAGGTVQLQARALWNDGRESIVTSSATWASDDDSVAAVAAGLVEGIAPGATGLTATMHGVVAHATVTVI